jgi:hypothetical protein
VGLQIDIEFAAEVPEWAAVAAKLSALGEVPTIKMIDNLPAFPDEVPEPGWRELRIGLNGGMLTLRRLPGMVSVVSWGSADANLTLSRERLAWAVAAAGRGMVREGGTTVTADAFFAARSLGPVDGHADAGR